MAAESLAIIAEQRPGTVVFSNYEQVKAAIIEGISSTACFSLDADHVKEAEAASKTLKKVRKALTDKKKELEAGYKAPLEAAVAQIDELVGILAEPIKIIDDFLADIALREKEEAVAKYVHEKASVLGAHADRITGSPAFANPRWKNKTFKLGDVMKEIDAKVDAALRDLDTIAATGGDKARAMIARYYETLSMDGMAEFMADLDAAPGADKGIKAELDQGLSGYKVIRLSGSETQMLQALAQLELIGLDVEVIEDGMPHPMAELTEPDFDTFVCFDIEHTGTYGAASGDPAPEIIEIGAVKVVGGAVVERFDQLANPGRKIIPRISRLTGITDEMVRDMPSSQDVVRMFKDFAGDLPLVGHNIKGCDLPHIARAARMAGFAFDNDFLDTKPLALSLKDRMGWENVKLEYLSQQFGIEQTDAHRAWCDAEANAQVYMRLRELLR